MTPKAAQLAAQWLPVPNGFRRRGSTCDNGHFCHIEGTRKAHSHYAWAAWLWLGLYGDMML